MLEETLEPGMAVSLVARRHGVAPNQLFAWHRLVVQGGLTAAGSGEEVVPRASPVARQEDVGSRNPQGGARTRHGVKKTAAAAAVAAEGRFPTKTVAEVIGVSRSNLVERVQGRPRQRFGRPPRPDNELANEIEIVIAELPTYGYRRVHAQAPSVGCGPPIAQPNVYRVMKAHGLLLDRHVGGVERRRSVYVRTFVSDFILFDPATVVPYY